MFKVGSREDAATQAVLRMIFMDAGLLRSFTEKPEANYSADIERYFSNAATLGIVSRLDTFDVPDSAAFIERMAYHRALTTDTTRFRSSIPLEEIGKKLGAEWTRRNPLADFPADVFGALMRVALEFFPWVRVACGEIEAPRTWRALLWHAYGAVDWIYVWARLNNLPVD